MLKLRKRRAPAMTIHVRDDSLKIRNLLDDPQLKVLMGDTVSGVRSAPIQLDWSRRAARQRQGFGRRLLLRAA
jgi:hypothetical protein